MTVYLTRYGAIAMALAYVGVSLAWIAGSDQLVAILSVSRTELTFLQTIKGTVFVLASGAGLYLLVRLYERLLTSGQRNTELRHREIIDASPALMMLVDPNTSRLVEVNRAARKHFGPCADRAAVGSGLFGLLWPDGCTDRSLATAVSRDIADAVNWATSAAEWTITDRSGRETVYAAGLSALVLDGRTLVKITLSDVTAPRVMATVLRELGAGLADKTGAAFHESLARSLTSALGVEHAFIAQIMDGPEGGIRTTARIAGGVIAKAVEFDRDGPLAGRVLAEQRAVLTNGIERPCADIERLGGPNVDSFAGVPLAGSKGNVLGVLAVLQSRPFQDQPLVLDVLTLAAGRAAAELERMHAETARAASEERFRQLAMISSDWLWEQDAQFRFTYLSERWHMDGHRPMPEVLGMPRWAYASVDVDRDENWISHRKALEAHEPFSDFTYRVLLPDGSIGHYRTSGTPVFDSTGRFVGYRGSTNDETEKVAALSRAEQAQARLLDAIESLPLGFALFDRDDRLVIINERYRARGGDVELPHAVGTRFEDLVRDAFEISPLHPSMGDPDAFCRERLARHRNLPSQQELRFANGRWIELLEYATREGETVLLWSDITERKVLEAEQRNNEERFRSIINEASQGIIVHRNMKPLYCNSAFASMFGFDRVDDVLSLDSILSLFSDSDQERMLEYCRARSQGRSAPGEYEFTGLRRDHSTIVVRNRVVRVTWDGEFAICANMFDISERKAVEAALTRSEEEYRGLVEGSVQGVVIHTGGELRFANKAAAQIFGYSTAADLLRVKSVENLFVRLARTAPDPVADPDRDDGEMFEAEYRRRDGSTVWLEVLVRAVEWRGDRSTQVTMLDATARKRAETALRRAQRMESIGQLTGGIAHDFNNLLAIVMGNLEFLNRQVGNDPKALTRIETALKATRRGDKLIRRLLGFASQDARPGTPTNANAVLAGLHDILSRSLTSEITLEARTDPGLWLTEIDPGDLEDAVLNLVLNARDAMPDGGRLTIETTNRIVESGWTGGDSAEIEIDAGEYVVVSVSDDGIGMPRENLERIFEPFFTTKSGDRGTGLGLSMVYGFARRSRGAVRIYSEIDHGTTVRMFLPRSTANELRTTPAGAHDALPGGSETILLVDDEADLLEVAEQMLRDLGYRTLSARNGREALAIISDTDSPDVDLVFSDVIMPGGVSGFDLADTVSERYPAIRILLASGFSGRLVARSGEDVPDHAMIHKPYERSTLARSIRQALASQPRAPVVRRAE